jgi:hypothetical protein
MSKKDPQVIRDLMSSVPPRLASKTAMAVADGLQNSPPHAQLMGLGFVFLALCDHWQIKPTTVFEMTQNITHDQGQVRPDFRAARQYIEYAASRIEF